MIVDRTLDVLAVLQNKSCFLFGPRQTGKSTLIRQQLATHRVYNLLDSPTLLALSREPERLRQALTPHEKIVVIDEIQKLPSLLNEVHLLIEERGIKFLLTGSSSRKLRQGGVNLLGGRARSRHLHPLTYKELGARFDLLNALNHGLIPSIYFSDAPDEDLAAYAGDYLKEEIAAEGLTRNIGAFSRFLEVAAMCNGQMLNYAKIASDAQVPRSTVCEYFSILKDTLIAHELPSWKKGIKRKAISTSKFYFFDTGVVRYLQHRRPVEPRSKEFGELFETYIFHELQSFADYTQCGELSYWRSTSDFEVDFILADQIAIEVKAKSVISPRELTGLRALKEEGKLAHYILLSLDPIPRTIDGILLLPWSQFLDTLWERKWI